jgi:hypothetical protein
MNIIDSFAVKMDEILEDLNGSSRIPTKNILSRHKYLFQISEPIFYTKGDRYLLLYFKNYCKIYIPFWWNTFSYLDEVEVQENLQLIIKILISRKTPKCYRKVFPKYTKNE